MPKPFSKADKIKVLLWCGRHCYLYEKPCGTDIEIAHIDPKGGNDLEDSLSQED